MTYRIGLRNGRPLIPKREWTIPDDYKKAISLSQACSLYFYSRNALIWQIKKGRINGFKIGRYWYVVPNILKTHDCKSRVKVRYQKL